MTELLDLLLKEAPLAAVIIVIGYFVVRFIKSAVDWGIKLLDTNRQKANAEEEMIKQEGKQMGVTQAERDAYKANHNTLVKIYHEQQEKINELDHQITNLTESIEKSEDRFERLLTVHESLSDDYKDMNASLKETVFMMSKSLENIIENTNKTNEKIKLVEKEIILIKENIRRHGDDNTNDPNI